MSYHNGLLQGIRHEAVALNMGKDPSGLRAWKRREIKTLRDISKTKFGTKVGNGQCGRLPADFLDFRINYWSANTVQFFCKILSFEKYFICINWLMI